MANTNDEVPAKKIKLSSASREELKTLSHEELVEKVLQQQQEIDTLKAKAPDSGLDDLLSTVEKLKQQVQDGSQQESKLVLRLSAKEHDIQELMNQMQEMKQAQSQSSRQLSAMVLDPAVNLMFYHMKQEMDVLKGKLEQAQNDLAAWKFTPDSQTGKRLMAKCRMLLQENEELGKNVSIGRVAKLEGDIALQKTLITEMKKSEAAYEEFVAETDEDMESMQNTVYLLQQELKEAKEKLQRYESASAPSTSQLHDVQNGQKPCSNRDAVKDEQRTDFSFEAGNEDRSVTDMGDSSVVERTRNVGAAMDNVNDMDRDDPQVTADNSKTVLDGVLNQEANCDVHQEFGIPVGDVVKNSNSDCWTSSSGELATTVLENKVTAMEMCNDETGINSGTSDDCCETDRNCHETSLRTAPWKTDALSDPKLNGIAVLVPTTDEND